MQKDDNTEQRSELDSSAMNTVQDEVLRSRIRNLIDEPKPQTAWKRASTNPITALIFGFVLTGIVGTLLTDHYNSKQKELDFALSDMQRDRDREKDYMLRASEFERDRLEREREADVESQRNAYQKGLERERDARQKLLEFQRSMYATELEREKSFTDALNKTRVGKISDVWEKVLRMEAEIPHNTDELRAIQRRRREALVARNIAEYDKVQLDFDKVVDRVRTLEDEARAAVVTNRFWLDNDTYRTMTAFIDATHGYVGARIRDLPEWAISQEAEKMEKLRQSVSQLRRKLIRE